MSKGIKYPRGSEWRKWDLHIHTPASYNYEDRSSHCYDNVIDAINKSDMDVYAVTDYFTLEGYDKLNSSGRLNKIIFPGIELRIEDSLLPSKHDETPKSDTPINLQIIFDNSEEIFSKVKEFVMSLEFEDYDGSKNNLTENNIIEVGKKKKTCKDNHEAYIEGCKLIRIPKSDIDKKLKEKGIKDKALIILPYEKYGGIDEIDPDNDSLIKSRLTKLADIIESSSDNQITFFLGQSETLPQFNEDGSKNDKFSNFIDKPKPCIVGSDSHKPETVGIFPQNKYCWIKADPTFEGLKQILYEPQERVYIGNSPPSEKTSANIIERIEIKDSNRWFVEEPVVLNENLVTIIGEKGAGKTALADFIALAGGDFDIGTDDPGSFVFKALKSTKQIEETIENCDITIYWKEGSHDSIKITDDFSDYKSLGKVRYLSQSFIERKCSPEQAEELQKEVENIIFQHIPIQDRLEQTTFLDLKKLKSQSIKRQQFNCKQLIDSLNNDVYNLEEEINSLSAKKKENIKLQSEIKQLEDKKPKPITKDEKNIEDKLNLLNNRKTELNDTIASYKAQLTTIETIKVQIKELKEYVEVALAEIERNLKLIDLTNILDKINFSANSDFDAELEKKNKGIQTKIKSLQGTESIEKNEVTKDINLDSLNDNYINKLTLNKITSLITLLESKSSIAKETRKTIKSLEEQIEKNQKRVNALEKSIKEIEHAKKPLLPQKIEERDKEYRKYFILLEKEKDILEEIYSPLKEKLSKESIGEKNKLDFFARFEFNVGNFYRNGHNIIDFSRKGKYFRGEDRLFKAIKNIAEKIEFTEDLDVYKHIRQLYQSFEKDDGKVFNIDIQLLKGKNKLDFYNWIFDISDFTVTYSIKYQGTNIELLSPGKKGIVLLLMYLALDTESGVPLIIDQPEENLDNKSVYSDLINIFRVAKKRRQIIVITHNPNLVLNTDAEQVIVANFEATPKLYRARLTYISGSIENSFIDEKLHIPLLRKGIREHGADILEGGREAFIKRKDKYAY